MFKQKPFPFSITILIILIVLHLTGSYFSWYWVFDWYDILVHIISGLWVASLLLWLAVCLGQVNSLKEYKVKTFLITFISAILLGVVWEIVENLSQVTSIDMPGYYLDTASDILNDGIGGILAFLYFIRKKKGQVQDSEIMHPFYNQTGLTNN